MTEPTLLDQQIDQVAEARSSASQRGDRIEVRDLSRQLDKLYAAKRAAKVAEKFGTPDEIRRRARIEAELARSAE